MRSLLGKKPLRKRCYRGLLVAGILSLSVQSVFGATFNVMDDPIFGTAKTTIEAYARARHAKGVNNFCVLGQLTEDRGKSAWIIWRQKKEIILWEGQNLVSTRPRRLIKLDKDVVASEAKLHGSSYLVTRQWVRDLISECDKAGLQAVVGPKG